MAKVIGVIYLAYGIMLMICIQKKPKRSEKLLNDIDSLQDKATSQKRLGDKIFYGGLIVGGLSLIFGVYRIADTESDINSSSFAESKTDDGPIFIGAGIGLALGSWLVSSYLYREGNVVDDFLESNHIGFHSFRVSPEFFLVQDQIVPGLNVNFKF